MRFKIVSVGWKCAGLWEQTLRSIEAQTLDNWDVGIAYDGGDDAGPKIQAWCDARDDRWNVTITDTQLYAVRNQVETIARLAPADDDIVVFLDLDGDQLAHPKVLERLAKLYADGTLLTYGSYRPLRPQKTGPAVKPFPPDVVAKSGYRKHMLTVECCFNHLRTLSGRIVNAIPADHFHWPSGPKKGQWYMAGTDYIFMAAGLELAGGRYKCVTEPLLIYNNQNPNADNLSHPRDSDACVQNYLRRRGLAPLPDRGAPMPELVPQPVSVTTDTVESAHERVQAGRGAGYPVVFLTAEERRIVLRDYGRRYGLKTLIETGTNDGGTPWALRDDFDEIFTIELGTRQWRAAVQKFHNYRHVHCLHGDSAEVLPRVLAQVKTPALIWLDGHYSGGDTAHGSKDTPVIEELIGIFATAIPHVVLVDDARLFEGMSHYGEHDWPHIELVKQLAVGNGYVVEIVDDIIRLTPAVYR